MDKEKAKKIIISAGGSGGHIFPALAIADAIKSDRPETKIYFVGRREGMENQIIPKAGYKLFYIPMGQMNSNVGKLKRLKTLFILPFAFLKSMFILIRIRPDLVMGVGGYVTFPIVLMASLMRFKTTIWEPNAFPGMANRALSKFVPNAMIIFEETKKYLKSKNFIEVGFPLRQEFDEVSTTKIDDAGGKFKVFVFGGSQGAVKNNDVICAAVTEYPEEFEDVEIYHQAGKYDYSRVKNVYNASNVKNITVVPFVDNMKERYLWSDLVICRGGMSTIAELAAVSKPAVIIPLASAADNHQEKNAQVLVEKEAALMIRQIEFTKEKFVELVIALKKNPKSLEMLSRNINSLYVPHSSQITSKEILNLI